MTKKMKNERDSGGTAAGHQRDNGAQKQQQQQEEQQDTDSNNNPTPQAHFAPTASHARHATHDADTEHGTRFPRFVDDVLPTTDFPAA